MNYEPTTWKNGDVVTSAKLNKIEEGIANSSNILIVHEDENGNLDKTWREIAEADISFIIYEDTTSGFFKNISIILIIRNAKNDYSLETATLPNLRPIVYTANSPDDYPIKEQEEQH